MGICILRDPLMHMPETHVPNTRAETHVPITRAEMDVQN